MRRDGAFPKSQHYPAAGAARLLFIRHFSVFGLQNTGKIRKIRRFDGRSLR
jgi:hypothetical protein